MKRHVSAQITMQKKQLVVKKRASVLAQEAIDSEGVWIYSFGDLMALLLGFFLMLYAISNISSEKFQALQQSLSQDSKDSSQQENLAPSAIEQKITADYLASLPVPQLQKLAMQAGPDSTSQMLALATYLQDKIKRKSRRKRTKCRLTVPCRKCGSCKNLLPRLQN